jgi:hypothetical protein
MRTLSPQLMQYCTPNASSLMPSFSLSKVCVARLGITSRGTQPGVATRDSK